MHLIQITTLVFSLIVMDQALESSMATITFIYSYYIYKHLKLIDALLRDVSLVLSGREDRAKFRRGSNMQPNG